MARRLTCYMLDGRREFLVTDAAISASVARNDFHFSFLLLCSDVVSLLYSTVMKGLRLFTLNALFAPKPLRTNLQQNMASRYAKLAKCFLADLGFVLQRRGIFPAIMSMLRLDRPMADAILLFSLC